MRCKRFYWSLPGLLNIELYNLKIGIIWFVLFLFVYFLYLSCLMSVDEISKTVLSKSDESGHFCLVPDNRGNTFSFFLVSMLLTLSLLYTVFIILSHDPYLPIFFRAFILFRAVKFFRRLFLHLLRLSCYICPLL
jgi:hypothetical protein